MGGPDDKYSFVVVILVLLLNATFMLMYCPLIPTLTILVGLTMESRDTYDRWPDAGAGRVAFVVPDVLDTIPPTIRMIG